MTPGPTEAEAHPAELAESIARLRRAMRRGARVADPNNELAVAQLELLSCLSEHPGVRPGQVARLLHLRPNSVTTLVNGLVGRGLIERTPAVDDRRAVTLDVSKAGQRAVDAWQATNSAVVHLAASTLTAQHRAALVRAVSALDALAKAIDGLADATAPSPAAVSGGQPRAARR